MPAVRHFLIALALTAAAPVAVSAAPADVAAAVSSPSRSADNIKLDASRKPAALLAFLGLQKGMTVLDMFGGNRYWSEILAPAVGPKGRVHVWEPTQFYDDKTKTAFDEFVKTHPTVSIVASPFESPQLAANSADFMLINLDYHDVYWENAKYGVKRMEPANFLDAVYKAMKPGGIVGVIDHVASPNSDTRATVDKLHRIDPAVVRADFERAGFKLEKESALLRNPEDDHSLLVFDPKIRGKTDRFIFKFRKPR